MDDEWFEELNEVEPAGDGQSLDEILVLLSNRTVRFVLYSLAAESATSLDRVADVVAGLEATETGDVVTPAERERVRIRLYHVTLPRLAAAGYLEFDTEDHTIRDVDIPPVVRSMLGIGG